MAFTFHNLDERTRQLMVAEIDRDEAAGTLYLSDNLSPLGRDEYPALLRTAAVEGSDATLAQALISRLNTHQKPRLLPSGSYSKAPVMRIDAHEMLAEGEFNRFYIRALCARSVEDGANSVVVYRAKDVRNARAESQDKIGQVVGADALLHDLRSSPGVDTALGLPPGPNSGLSVMLPPG